MDENFEENMEEIVEEEIGNDGLKKKIIKEGDGYETPINGDEVEGNVCRFYSC